MGRCRELDVDSWMGCEPQCGNDNSHPLINNIDNVGSIGVGWKQETLSKNCLEETFAWIPQTWNSFLVWKSECTQS
jgi:hypothetical protein